MTDFGHGWDPSFDFPLAPTFSAVPAVSVASLISDKKVAYLSMQEAIAQKDAAGLQSLVQTYPDVLTESRQQTLGRLIMKNFTPQLAAAVDLPWESIIQPSVIMQCVNSNDTPAFDFSLQVFKRTAHPFELYSVAQTLCSLNSGNYKLYDTYRKRLMPFLKSSEVDQLAEDLVNKFSSFSEENVHVFTQLIDDCKDAQWAKVFNGVTPFKLWYKPEHAWGLAYAVKNYPTIANGFNHWQKESEESRAAFLQFISDEVFSPGWEAIPAIDFKTVLRPQAAELENYFLGIVLDSPIESSPLLSVVQKITVHQGLSVELNKKFSKHTGKTYVYIPNGLENIIRSDPLQALKIYKTHPQALAGFLSHCANTSSFVRSCVENLSRDQMNKVLAAMPFVRDETGNTIAHYYAHATGYVDADILKNFRLDWNAPNAMGVSAKQIILDKNAYQAEYLAHLFAQHENNVITTALRNSKRPRTRTSLRRKM